MKNDRIEVSVSGFEGEYDLDWEEVPPTGNELHAIKVFSGCRAAEIPEALMAGDYDLVCILAALAMQRAGKCPPGKALDVASALRDAPAGLLRYLGGDAEPDPTTAPRQENDTSATFGANGTSSGDDSAKPSESRVEIPEPTGTPV